MLVDSDPETGLAGVCPLCRLQVDTTVLTAAGLAYSNHYLVVTNTEKGLFHDD
jgi:hypothetical protein